MSLSNLTDNVSEKNNEKNVLSVKIDVYLQNILTSKNTKIKNECTEIVNIRIVIVYIKNAKSTKKKLKKNHCIIV